MAIKIIYFSRTGSSKRIAHKIADLTGGEAIALKDHMNWFGGMGYFRAAICAMQKRELEIEVCGTIDEADTVVVVSPLWAGGPANAVLSLFKQIPKSRVHLVMTSNASLIRDTRGYLSVSSIVKKANHEDVIIADLLKKLMV